MSNFNTILLQTESSGGGSMLMQIGPIVLIVAIFYFFMIRPQRKKQKDHKERIRNLVKGTNVVTIGGIHGVISSVKENTFVLKVADQTKLEFNKEAISTIKDEAPKSENSKVEAEPASDSK